MKTIIQELVDIMNKDQVSFTEWFLDNYKNYLEKEKEHLRTAYNKGRLNEMDNINISSKEYYDQTYNNETIN